MNSGTWGWVAQIREARALPVQDPSIEETRYEQEGSQPPLYYAVVAALTLPISFDDFDAISQMNPHAKVGVPGATDNKNIVLHTPISASAQSSLAVYIGRIFSALCVAWAIVMVYRVGHLLGGELVGLLAAGITAFNPMLIFIAGSVNNDNLVIALNSTVIYLALRTLLDGFEVRRSLWLAVILALATLTKISGVVLVPMVIGVAFMVLLRERDWRGFLWLGTWMFVSWATLAGWWYARNILLYGELFGTYMMAQVAGVRLETFTIETILQEFTGFRATYWGLYGGVNVLSPVWLYTLMDIVTVLGVTGCLAYLWRKRRQTNIVVPMVWMGSLVILAFASLIQWTALTYASQGRLLFPYVAVLHTLLAIGLWHWGVRHIRVVVVALVGFVLMAAIMPIIAIAPAYTPVPALARLPDEATAVAARYGDVVELVGYETADVRYTPNENLRVTLYWHTLSPTDRNYSLFVHILDANANVIGRIDTYPAGGLRTTTTWEQGVIYADTYDIPFDERDAQSLLASDLRLLVGWWYLPNQQRLPMTDFEDNSLDSVVLDAGGLYVDAPVLSDDWQSMETDLGAIGLRGVCRDGEHIQLIWEALQPLSDDFTVFVQALDSDDNIVAQGDAPPMLATRHWRIGDRHVTQHRLRPADNVTEGGSIDGNPPFWWSVKVSQAARVMGAS
jgi:4-amino-4-deoxy-L-arabinose transferase-like glycosyltransferase